MLDDLAGGFSGIDAADKAIRTAAVYVVLLLLLRLAGKRQLAQLSTLDLVVLLLLANVVQNAVIGDDASLVGGLLGAAILVGGNYLVVRFAFLHPRFGRDLQGRATALVEGGHLRHRAMRRELISRAELEAALRRQGYGGLTEVERVVLEPEGTFEVERRPQPTIADVLAALERIEKKLG